MCDGRQAFYPSWKDGRPHGVRYPMKEELRCRSAYSALTGPHAATRLQLGSTPRRVSLQAGIWDILTPAHQRVWLSQTPQFRPQVEGSLQLGSEFPTPFSPRKEPASICLAAARSEPSNLPLD